MSVVHAQDSPFAKEMRKWEAHHTQYGPPGRPYTFTAFPARLYRATRGADGIKQLEGMTAHTEDEQRNLESRGYVAGGQQAALDVLAADELEIAKLAAERNYDERRMSEKAQAEAQAANRAAGARHLGSVPETPIKKRQPWRKKAEAVTE